jgi:hypothetical protein
MKLISQRTHAIAGILISLIIIHAPWLFGYGTINHTAEAVAIIVGIIILAAELTADDPISPLKLVPMRWHILIDVTAGSFLALSPWIFKFADQPTNVWMPHLVLGLLVIGYALATDPESHRISLAH